MSTAAITRPTLPIIGAYIPAVFLGAYLQSSSDFAAAKSVLFLLPVVTLAIARARTSSTSATATHLAAVPEMHHDNTELVPVLSLISRAS